MKPKLAPLCLVALTLLVACNDGDKAAPGISSDVGARSFGTPSNSNIRPGVQIRSRHGTCTASFLFRDLGTFYLGAAAHCFSQDTNTGIDPCNTRNEQIGFREISIENASRPGALAYSSWSAMQQSGERPGSDVCRFNDFALVQIHPDDVANVHPAAFSIGGPTRLLTSLAAIGDRVFSYGRSPFHLGLETLESRQGNIVDIQGGGWFYRVSSPSPGLPGDSGGPVLHESGAALGVVSDLGVTVGLTLAPVTNGVVNLNMALEYGKRNGFIRSSMQLETWAEFTP